MEKKEFQAESKRIMELMINSIYTHKEIFLRELISNAADAIDKIYYKAMSDENIEFNKDDYYIEISYDKENRTISISDTGIGMNAEELEENLGVIAKSGSLAFKQKLEKDTDLNIIGQFGVGFYSAFMVADEVSVHSKSYGSDMGYLWHSYGVDGYTVEEKPKDGAGTVVTLHLKADTEDEKYSEFLDEYKIKSLIKKYSDFIRYPIRMQVEHRHLKDGSEDEYETVIENETLNSMVPIWRKNKNELTEEDYNNFYVEKRYGFDTPLSHIHVHVDGNVIYDAVLYIPEETPYGYYTPEYEKGLELYSSGVLIMEKCPDLLPDFFSFVKGMVDSQDLSLNISREMLQHDRQLKLIAKNIQTKIKNELENMLKSDREKYEKFFQKFGRQLKFGVYQDFGTHKDTLQDLLLFYSTKDDKNVTLKEYTDNMSSKQEYIYYGTGETVERIKHLPQAENILEKGYGILCLTEDIDEFAIKIISKYADKEFKNVASQNIDSKEDEYKPDERDTDILNKIKDLLKDKVKDVKLSNRLKSHAVCFTTDGEISIEMEKVINKLPGGNKISAGKILEINPEHQAYTALKNADDDKLALYVNLLYNQACMIEGLEIENPVAFADDICKLM